MSVPLTLNELKNSNFYTSTTDWSVWQVTAGWSSCWASITATAQWGMLYQPISSIPDSVYYYFGWIDPSTAPTNNYIGFAGNYGWLTMPIIQPFPQPPRRSRERTWAGLIGPTHHNIASAGCRASAQANRINCSYLK